MNSANPIVHDVVGVGFGPSNLALAIALREAAQAGRPQLDCLFLERQTEFQWHGNMLLDGSRMQISFLKDLATLRNPASPFTFLNYLHQRSRLSDFINLKTFFPSRHEFNDYLRWAAAQFADVCHYSEEVFAVEPVTSADGGIDLLRVRSRNAQGERETLARNLVIGMGGSPRVPDTLKALREHPAVFHSSQYLTSIERQSQARRVAILGAGQSAVEIFLDLHDRNPDICIDLITRSSALKPSDDSPFVNEIFNPEHVDYMYGRNGEERSALLDEFANTNYAAGDIDLIERIYAVFYQQKVRGGTPRHRLLTRHTVREALPTDMGINLMLEHAEKQGFCAHLYDTVILATGYERRLHHQLLAPMQPWLGELSADRNYRVQTEPALRAGIFLQGYCEHSHGLSDTLLSILPVRSEEITGALLHGTARKPTTRVGAMA